MTLQDDPTEVPADFPVRVPIAAITGAQPKLAVLLGADGRYRASGTSPEQTRADYEMCEDLAQQLVAYCRKKLPLFKSRKRTMVAVYRGLLAKRWCTADQSLWVIRRTAVLLQWPAPTEHANVRTRPGLKFRAGPTDPAPT